MMSQAMRKLAGNLNRTQTLCVFTNQIREKVGVMFGSPETQPGGRALKFYASQRLDIRRIETLKDGTEAVGNRVRVKVVKNKVAAPFKQAEFDIEFGKGISTSGCLLDYGIEHNIVTKSGSFFSYGDERLGQGRGNAKAFLDEHQDIAKEIETKIYAALGIGQDLVKPIEHSDAPDAELAEDLDRGGRGPGGLIAPDVQRKAQARTAAAAALEVAYAYLNRRERTVAEVRCTSRARRRSRRMRIDVVLAELLEFGYLDDARYRPDVRAGQAGAGGVGQRADRSGRCASAGWTASSWRWRLRSRRSGVSRRQCRRDWEDAANGELARAVALLVRRFPAGPAQDRRSGARLRSAGAQGLRERALAADAVREWARRGGRRLIARPSASPEGQGPRASVSVTWVTRLWSAIGSISANRMAWMAGDKNPGKRTLDL